MRTVTAVLSEQMKEMKILPLADIHLGDANCDIKRLKERIEYIKNNENVYTLLNGDLMNNATKLSVSDIYTETTNPHGQIQMCVDMLKPIRDKILCITSGNHCARTYRNEGIDLMQVTARYLDMEHVFSQGSCLIFLRFGSGADTRGEGSKRGRQCYTIYALHGSGGGRKEGAKAIRLADMASVIDADIYIHSHTHLPMVMKEDFFRADTRSRTVAQVSKLFVNTGAHLKYGGYAEAAEFKPASLDTPIITLNGTKKCATATL